MTTRLLPVALCLAGLVATTFAEEPSSSPTCPPAKGRRLVTTTYQVADLVVPVDCEARRIVVGPGQAEAVSPWKPSATVKARNTGEEPLIRLITNTIQPRSWSERGGPGTIDYFPLTMALVINQTPDVQDQIQDLLQALRRLQDQEVSVEVRIATLPESFFCERIGIDFDKDPKVTVSRPCPDELMPKSPDVKVLDDSQFVRLMEAMQDCRETNVMQAPKLTAFNHQRFGFCFVDDKPFVTGLDVRLKDGHLIGIPKTETFSSGIELSIEPVISPDRRSVRVDVQAVLKDVDTSAPTVPVSLPILPVGGGSEDKAVVFTQYLQQPRARKLAIEKTFTVPDGHTMVVDAGTRTSESRVEYGPPILSDIPFLNRLFRNVGYSRSRERVLLLVTPRIIQQEEEERQTGVVIPPTVIP
jgi:general secretion pathway protein D